MSVSIRWHGPRVASAARDAAFDELVQQANRVLEVSSNLVPWKSGNLGGDTDVRDERTSGYIEFGYGYNSAKAYAAHQHSPVTRIPRTYTKPGTGPEYLSQPMEQMGPSIDRAVQAAVRRAMGGMP